MKMLLFLLFTVLAPGLQAQDILSFSGKITDAQGYPVEYAAVGIPGKNIGTFSAADGAFTLQLPTGEGDTLHISHVSYEETRIPVARLCEYNEPIAMQARELAEVVVYNGEKRPGKLAGRGTRIPGAVTMWSISDIGCEIGSIIETDKVFEVREIEFRVRSNSIGGAKFSVNIYRAVEETGEFHSTLCTPLYIEVPLCNEWQDIIASFGENVVMEPGCYFVSVMFVGCDEPAEIAPADSRILFPLYMKRSYKRGAVLAELEECPVNMGLVVRGYEYR